MSAKALVFMAGVLLAVDYADGGPNPFPPEADLKAAECRSSVPDRQFWNRHSRSRCDANRRLAANDDTVDSQAPRECDRLQRLSVSRQVHARCGVNPAPEESRVAGAAEKPSCHSTRPRDQIVNRHRREPCESSQGAKRTELASAR